MNERRRQGNRGHAVRKLQHMWGLRAPYSFHLIPTIAAPPSSFISLSQTPRFPIHPSYNAPLPAHALSPTPHPFHLIVYIPGPFACCLPHGDSGVSALAEEEAKSLQGHTKQAPSCHTGRNDQNPGSTTPPPSQYSSARRWLYICPSTITAVPKNGCNVPPCTQTLTPPCKHGMSPALLLGPCPSARPCPSDPH